MAEREGQLTVYSGWPRRRRVLLSAATTSRTIVSAMSNGHSPSANTRANLESISDALGVLEYGRLRPADEGRRRRTRQRAGREHASGPPHSLDHAVAATHGAGVEVLCRTLTLVPPLQDLPIALRTTWDEWMRTRWSDLQFERAQDALLVFIVLLAVVVLLLVHRHAASARPHAGRAAGACCR